MIVNKYNNGNGGGGSGSTITVDAALSSSSTNPVQNKVITNTLNSLSEQIPVVDSAVTSASTNAVESQAVYLEIHGETASTQLEVSTAVTEYYLTYFLISNNPTVYQTRYFRETNLPGWYGFYLEDATNTALTYDWYMLSIQQMNLPGINKFSNSYQVSSDALLGSPLYFSTADTGNVAVISNAGQGNLDGTMKYWFVIDTNTGTAYVYKNLPVIHEVTGGMPSFDDLPVAQDGSPTKYYVYDGGKKVLSDIYYRFEQYLGSRKGDSRIYLNATATTWAGNIVQPGWGMDMIYGNEIVPGFKTIRDSVVINDVENALSGFTEQVTLTVGSDTQNTIKVGSTLYNLKSTNDSRYLVLDMTSISVSQEMLQNLTISGTQYNFLNTLYKKSGNYNVNGRYQLGVNGGDSRIYVQFGGNLGNNYLIIDKDLLIAEISDSLTITRTKNIASELSGVTGSSITVDNALSSSSTNPVENRVITNALGNYVQSTTVRTIVTCTQAQYDLMTHDPNTFYIITGVNS